MTLIKMILNENPKLFPITAISVYQRSGLLFLIPPIPAITRDSGDYGDP